MKFWIIKIQSYSEAELIKENIIINALKLKVYKRVKNILIAHMIQLIDSFNKKIRMLNNIFWYIIKREK